MKHILKSDPKNKNKKTKKSSNSTWKIEVLEPKLLLSADAIPGIYPIQGTILQPGQQNTYDFVVQQQTRFLFDGVQGDHIQWALTGPTNANSFSTRNLTDTGDKFLDLQPGTYHLNVDGVQDQTGTYSFRLLGEDAAVQLNPNSITQGTLNPSTQAQLYRLDVQAGDRLFLQSGSPSATGYWTLFDPTANVISGRNGLNTDSGVITASKTGPYWLSIEGTPDATASLDYSFTLFRQHTRMIDLTLGQSYTTDLVEPGAATTYQFNIDQPQLVAWDQLTAGANDLRWTLLNENGVQVGSASTALEDGVLQPMLLQAGKYTLQIESLDRNFSNVGFRLLSAASASTLDSMLNVAIPTDSNRSGQVIRINAAQLSSISIDNQSFNALGNTIDQAKEVLVAANSTTTLAVSLASNPVPDIDLYRIGLQSGDALHLNILTSTLNAYLRLFDAQGQELTSAQGGLLDYTALADGVYYIGISGNNNQKYDPLTGASAAPTSAGTLTLQVTRTATATTNSSGDVGDTLAQAQELIVAAGSSTTVNVTIGDSGNSNDVDMYRLMLAAGDTVQLSTPNGSVDGYARIFNQLGQMVSSTDDSPLNYVVPSTGIYYIGLSGYPNYAYNPNVAGSLVNSFTHDTTFTNQYLFVYHRRNWPYDQ
jgi:hypothetical protein